MKCSSSIIPGCIGHSLPLGFQVLALLSLLPQTALRYLHGTWVMSPLDPLHVKVARFILHAAPFHTLFRPCVATWLR